MEEKNRRYCEVIDIVLMQTAMSKDHD